MTPADREFVRNFINDNCITRVPPGSKELLSYKNQGSGYYTWQFYLREALFNPRILEIITNDFLDRYESTLKLGELQLCGVESASTPILTCIAIGSHKRGYPVNVFSIRKERKEYGKRNWLEGKIVPNKLIMMVDDLISENHKTSIHAASVLFNHGLPIIRHVYTLVYKTDHPKNNVIKLLGHNTTVDYVFSLNDFELELKAYQERKSKYLDLR